MVLIFFSSEAKHLRTNGQKLISVIARARWPGDSVQGQAGPEAELGR
jgi:hypothetical protein